MNLCVPGGSGEASEGGEGGKGEGRKGEREGLCMDGSGITGIMASVSN